MAQSSVATNTPQNGGEIMESVIIKGDLGKLSPEERSRYYMEVCKSVGLNPFTQPFAYITLNGKLTLYATKSCTDQLRSIHNVSVEDLAETERGDVFIVTAKVRDKNGRTDMAKGAVTIGSAKGDTLANLLMKAETKAKRRATLSICGLGMLDESEIETIPASAKSPAPATAAPLPPPKAEPPHDPVTGEVKPHQIQIGYVQTDNGDASDWIGYGRSFIAAVKSAASLDELRAWQDLNQAGLASCAENAPKAYGSVVKMIDKRRAELAPKDAEIIDQADTANVLLAV